MWLPVHSSLIQPVCLLSIGQDSVTACPAGNVIATLLIRARTALITTYCLALGSVACLVTTTCLNRILTNTPVTNRGCIAGGSTGHTTSDHGDSHHWATAAALPSAAAAAAVGMGSSGQPYYSPHHYAAAAAVHAATSGMSSVGSCGGNGGGGSHGGNVGSQSVVDGGHNLESTAAAAAAAYGYGCHQWMGRTGENSATLPGNNNNVEGNVSGGGNSSTASTVTTSGVKMDISAMSAWAAALQQPEYKEYNG